MKNWAVTLVGMASVFVPSALWGQNQSLTGQLQQLFDCAEQNNASLIRMRAAIATAEAGEETARLAQLPDVEAQLSISYLGDARLWNRTFGESMAAPMPLFGNNFLLRAEQVVYSGGAITCGIRLAEQQTKMLCLSADEQRQRVRFLLVGLYLQLHSLRHQETVYATNRELALRQIELMNHRREQGVSLRNDITRYELQLQQIALGQTTVSDRQSVLTKQLRTALGTDSVPLAMLSDDAFEGVEMAVGSEEDWLRLALEQHKTLQRSALAVDISHTQERLVEAERYPQVALVAEDHLDGPITIEVPPINKNLNYWFVGIGVRYNLASLYKTKRKVQQAKRATAEAQTQLTVAQQTIGDDVHAAYVDLGTARSELQTRRKAVQLATENYEVVGKRYKNGLALITDMTDAANVKLEAELALVSARINLAYCYCRLKYACQCL